MYNPQMTKAFLDRVSYGKKHTGDVITAIQGADSVAKRLNEVRERISTNTNLTQKGRSEELQRIVKSELAKELAIATRAARRSPAYARSKRAALKLPEPDTADVVAALQRQELRAIFRGMPIEKRHDRAAQMASDPDVAMAVLEAHPMASGLDEPHPGAPDLDTVGNLREAVLRQVHGPALAEIDEILADYEPAVAMANAVRMDLQEASGLTPKDFEGIMKPIEADVDGGS